MTYDVSVRARVLAGIADGRSLRAVCADEGMPHRDTVRGWLLSDPDFLVQYARAREEQADSYADEIADIADNSELAPDDRRVRIDARKWIASKLKPKKYGDRTQTDLHVSGSLTQIIESLPIVRRPDSKVAG